jgi:hypothetical protein
MDKYGVVEILAREQRVERLVQVICKVTSPILADLAQVIYLALLEYDNDTIVELYEKDQMNFFLVRIIKNQWYSKTSPFYNIYRKFSRHSNELSNETADNMFICDREE